MIFLFMVLPEALFGGRFLRTFPALHIYTDLKLNF